MNIKNKFPDEDALKKYISDNLTSCTAQIRAEVGHLEASYQKARKSVVFALGVLVIGAVCAYLLLQLVFDQSFRVTGPSSLLLSGSAFCFALWMVFISIKHIKSANKIISKFNKLFNQEIFSIIFDFFDLPIQIVETTGTKSSKEFTFLRSRRAEQGEIMKLLDQSQLITEPRNTVESDDVMITTIGSDKLRVAEFDVKHITGSGKNRRVKKIFKGYFVSFELDRHLKGKTFISTEGDESGFGHRSFWSKFSDKGIKVTELEWNEFEELLHVMSTDPIETRYVLSTDFMQDLYEWWHTKKQNIRISFIGNQMCMLFPSKKIRFGSTVASISEDEIREYIESIALPLLHVLHLIENVKQEFNK